MNPEKMVVNESRRLLTQLNVFDIPVDAAVVNRVLSEDAGFPDPILERQEKYLEQIEDDFQPLPTFHAPRMEVEVVGIEALRDLASELWGEHDPTAVHHKEKPLRVEEKESGDGYTLELNLPFTEKDEVDLREKGDELIIQIGDYRRNVFLPSLLRNYSPEGARFKEEKLRIGFGPDE